MATNNWKGRRGTATTPTSGDWGAAGANANWSTGTTPLSIDNVVLGGTTGYTLTISGTESETSNTVTINDGNATLLISGTTALLTLGNNLNNFGNLTLSG